MFSARRFPILFRVNVVAGPIPPVNADENDHEVDLVYSRALDLVLFRAIIYLTSTCYMMSQWLSWYKQITPCLPHGVS